MESIAKNSLGLSKISEGDSSGSHTTESRSNECTLSLPYFDNIINPSNMITCDACHRNITNHAHILCEWGEYCVACFVTLDHFPSVYHVIGKLDFSLFHPEWSAFEELIFFSAIERLGYGNWEQIRIELRGSKSVEHISEHYETFFNRTDGAFPKLINTGRTDTNYTKTERKEGKGPYKMMNELRYLRDEMAKNEAKTDEKGFSMIRYSPKRGEFEIEYDDDLELMVSQMEFLESDTAEETQLKQSVLTIFSERLNKRNTIKDFVINRKILDLNEMNRKDRLRTKEEKEIAVMLKPFARFITQNQYEQLVNGVAKENELKSLLLNINQPKNKKQVVDSHENSLSRKKKLEMKKKLKSKQGGQRLAFLTEEDYNLCQSMQISQVSFVMIRQTIKIQLLRRGKLPVEYFYSIFKLKPHIVKQIYISLTQSHLKSTLQ